jgi:Zn-dependent protease/predicted transcriptional regulator
MKHRGISLGKFLGIPLGVDYSWFLIFVLLTWSLAAVYYPDEFRGWPIAEYWILGAVTTIMLFVSVLLHEFGHSLVAIRYKLPVRGITLFIFGGMSEIGEEPHSAISQFWVSLAGPLVSFALAGLFALLQPVLAASPPLLVMDKYLFYINAALGIFNLIPGLPLDGGGVFLAIVWKITHNQRRSTLLAVTLGRFIAYAFIIVGVWQVFEGNWINGLWIGFIGWFLVSAAGGEAKQLKTKALLDGHKVTDAMNRSYAAVPPDITLQQIVDDHVLGQGRRSLVVEQDGKLVGLLTLHHIKEVARDDWWTTTAEQVMIPADKVIRIQPGEELWPALQQMDKDGVNQLPVMTDGHAEGVLAREDLISYLRTLEEIGDDGK